MTDLDGLPVLTIIVDDDEIAWQKQTFAFDTQEWFPAGSEMPADEHYSPTHPVTVLWAPT